MYPKARVFIIALAQVVLLLCMYNYNFPTCSSEGRLAPVSTSSQHTTIQETEAPRQQGTVSLVTQETVALRPKVLFLKEPSKELNDSCSRTTCKTPQDAKWKMVTFVKSALNNFRQRETLRRTWASVRELDGVVFRTIFVVGRGNPGANLNLLDAEQNRYGDILQYDGPDDYKNIMQKTLAGMQWAADNLPPHFMYSSGDDDVVINPVALRQQVDTARAKMDAGDWGEFPVVCAYAIMPHDAPHRERGSKWRIDKSDYPWHLWPVSCFGGFYTTRVSFVAKLYGVSRLVPLLRFDDVWVTGVLRHHAGMPDDMVLPPSVNDTVRHREGKEDMDAMWRKVLPDVESSKACICR